MNTITFGSRVTTCDCLLTGRISMVWKSPPDLRPPAAGFWPYYRVHFPPRSPFLDDWAVYRAHEVALYMEQPPLVNLNVVNLMRPKVPTL
jgi:hypothetical protein